jgi:hypothetical protein
MTIDRNLDITIFGGAQALPPLVLVRSSWALRASEVYFTITRKFEKTKLQA